MMPPATPNPYKRHRFPGEIISHADLLYNRISLSHYVLEELLHRYNASAYRPEMKNRF